MAKRRLAKKRGAPFGNKNAVGNRGGHGATPKYDPDEHPHLARECTKLGATNARLADIMRVSEKTIERWTREHPEFRHALHQGRMEADGQVAHSLYRRAIGYTHPDEKIFSHPATRWSKAKVVRVRTRKHYPPDTAVQPCSATTVLSPRPFRPNDKKPKSNYSRRS
jgi:hypothetical protein